MQSLDSNTLDYILHRHFGAPYHATNKKGTKSFVPFLHSHLDY